MLYIISLVLTYYKCINGSLHLLTAFIQFPLPPHSPLVTITIVSLFFFLNETILWNMVQYRQYKQWSEFNKGKSGNHLS